MMKRMFGFCGVCAAAGEVAGSDIDSDINVVAPSNAARDRSFQPVAAFRGTIEMSEFFVQSTMALLSYLQVYRRLRRLALRMESR
jgi:hypothetical protein